MGCFPAFPLYQEENKEKGKCERKQFWSKATRGVGGGIYLMICYAFQVVNTKYIISGPSFT